MSNYLPRTQKKRERQERLETDLRRLVANGASEEKLVAAAEELRAARIRTVKARRQHCCFIGSTSQFDTQIAELQTIGVEVILSEFGWPPLSAPDVEHGAALDTTREIGSENS